MSQLLRPDLNRVSLDAESFLGRTLALGQEHGRLPEHFLEGLMAYLRLRGLEQAQRQRTSIRLGREGLEKAIRQCLLCLDLALEERANGDVNQALEILAKGDFEELRRRGWEMAFHQLEELRQKARLVRQQPQMAFLPEHRASLDAWASLLPETWTGTSSEQEAVEIDPRQDQERFAEVEARLAFLRSLPGQALQRLLEVEPEGMSFSGVLRRVVLALALGREDLEADQKAVRRFRKECFANGELRPAVKQRVLEELGRHLERTLKQEAVRALILQEAEAELQRLEESEALEWLLPQQWTTRRKRG
jgi:hypothetical protein